MGGCTEGKIAALLGGELQTLSGFLSHQMCASKPHTLAAWIDAHEMVPTVC